jgi:hypothetical protein
MWPKSGENLSNLEKLGENFGNFFSDFSSLYVALAGQMVEV